MRARPEAMDSSSLPLSIFGPDNFGYRLGLIGAPSRMAQALAPLAFGLLIDVMGGRVLIVSSALSLSALAALMLLRPARQEQQPSPDPSPGKNSAA